MAASLFCCLRNWHWVLIKSSGCAFLKALGCLVQPNARHSFTNAGAIFAETSRQTLFSIVFRQKTFSGFKKLNYSPTFILDIAQNVWSVLGAQRYWSEIRQKNSEFTAVFLFTACGRQAEWKGGWKAPSRELERLGENQSSTQKLLNIFYRAWKAREDIRNVFC